MAEIRLESLTKRFGDLVAVRDLNITFPSSTVTCLLGPSGCGKTTLMRMIAGLETSTSGKIYFGDTNVTELSPSQRNIGMVFQYPVVYRGMNVYKNVELPLKHDKTVSKQERKERVESVLETLELASSARKRLDQLDNGTLQKVAVAREVARRPRIILFDEPITNVDVAAKTQLKLALKRLSKQHNQTIIYVTHDQTEAMTLADEIALMRDGEIVQRDTPQNLYDNPNDRFGGWFLGNPGMNFVPHEVYKNGGLELTAPLFTKPVHLTGFNIDHKLLVGIRPEWLQVNPTETAGYVPAEVVQRAIVVGGQYLLTLRVSEHTLKAKVPPTTDTTQIRRGDTVWVRCPLEHVSLFGQDGHKLDASFTA
ncbi:MAG: ABC transporter ATP-binding protein [Deinococcota bacterium]